MIRLETKNYNVILTEKQQKYQLHQLYIYKNEYLTGEEILPSDQSRMIEQAKFTYSPQGKALNLVVKKNF